MHGNRYCALTTEWFKGKNSNVTTSPAEAVRVSGSNLWAPLPTVTTCTRVVFDDPRAELFGAELVNMFRAPINFGKLDEFYTSDSTRSLDIKPYFISDFLDGVFQMAKIVRRYTKRYNSATASSLTPSA
jgi:hypothetical protein